jgi:uncharacterized protein (TIGR03435 family)
MQNTPSGWILQGTAVPLTRLTGALSDLLGRPVTDRSGAKPGLYDFNLNWRGNPAALRVNAGGDAAAVPDGPSIFTALQEQLGLRLISTKGSVEVIVIDQVQRPLPN